MFDDFYIRLVDSVGFVTETTLTKYNRQFVEWAGDRNLKVDDHAAGVYHVRGDGDTDWQITEEEFENFFIRVGKDDGPKDHAVGHIVRLSSGGPGMTVRYVGPELSSGDRAVKTQWFDTDNHLQDGEFLGSTLVRVK